MISKLLTTISFICACVPTQAQINLVKNGGFEQYIQCPSNFDQVAYATPWNGIDTNWAYGDPASTYHPPCLPDYINGCSIWGGVTDPISGRFYQYPHSGNGMMQMVLYCDTPIFNGVIENDYLQERLYSTLIGGKSYCVTFYVNLENESSFAINNIGAYLDDGTIDTTSQCSAWQTEYTPQILDTAIIRDTLNWVKIQGSFIANGTEQFITIGNFFDTAHTRHIRLNEGWEGWYLIDDVSVIASNATAYAGPDVSIAPGDTAWIGVDSNGDGMPCYWYVLDSTTAIDSGGRIAVHPTDTTTYVVTMDLCGNVTYDTVRVNVVAGLGINNVQTQNVQMWPNPVSAQITITAGSKITSIVISNLIGQEVYTHDYNTTTALVNVADLPPGVYYVKINDVVVKRFVKL